MLLPIAFLTVLAYLSYFYYTRVHLTKQTMEYYRREFEKAGYRVKFIPFRLYSLGVFGQMIEDQNKHKNPTYTLENHSQEFDVVVCSTFNFPVIELYNVNLIQAFYANGSNNYVKFEPLVGNLRRVVGSGLAFSEGDDWKKKRRIVCNVFHFDFLNSLVPKMNEVVDYTFQELDNSQPSVDKKPGELVTFYHSIVGNILMRFFFGGDNVKE